MTGRCYHCGEPLPPDPPMVLLDGDRRPVCCQGCAGAAQWIRDAGLGDYYRLRASEGLPVDLAALDYSAWDREDVQTDHSRSVDSGREITILVEGMQCAACAWLIDKALSREPGVLEVQPNAVTGRVRIVWDPARAPLSQALRRLASLGYRPHLAPGEALERERRRERRDLLMRLGVAGLGSFQAMMFAEALYLDFDNQMPLATREFFRWITLLVSTPVVFYAGWPFIAGMRREASLGRYGMDTLVASSILLAYFASLIETLRGGPHVWFDAAVMFVFLLLAARVVERLARQRANAAVDTLARAQPALAWRLLPDGSREQVPLKALSPGDMLAVAVGETVPADGTLLEEAGEFDEALLTGESAPVTRAAGESVYAGSVCRHAPAKVKVERTGADTRLADLVRLVEQAQAGRPRLAEIGDAIAAKFVPALFVCAAVVALVWWWIEPGRAFEVTLAVLVVSCPCALSLAIPAALGAAQGTLARMGVLSLRPDAIDALARADHLLIDKTGTLSQGRPRIGRIQVLADHSPEAVLLLAASLERDAGHPIAQAFARQTLKLKPATALRAVPGQGVEGVIDGRLLRLGRAGFAAGAYDDGAIWLGDGDTALARFEIDDPLRPDAGDAIRALRTLGLDPEVLSGDGAEAVAALAGQLGLGHTSARQSPEDKLSRLRALQASGGVVAMLGDGINDAPVLAGADVSLAMADGAPLAHRSADLVLTSPKLMRLPDAIVLARKTRRIIRQNLLWALGYNLLALPLAALGMVTPWLAALGMALSSLLVTLNALRLAQAPKPLSS